MGHCVARLRPPQDGVVLPGHLGPSTHSTRGVATIARPIWDLFGLSRGGQACAG